MARAGVSGPLFISLGQPDQLATFLSANSPDLDQAIALVDTSKDFQGYKAAGFNLLLGDQTLETPPDFKPPKTMVRHAPPFNATAPPPASLTPSRMRRCSLSPVRAGSRPVV